MYKKQWQNLYIMMICIKPIYKTPIWCYDKFIKKGKTINLQKRRIQQYNSQMAVSFLTKD